MATTNRRDATAFLKEIQQRNGTHKWESSTRLLEEQEGDTTTYYGLLISLDDDNVLRMKFCPDENFHSIHPNIYAPASLHDVTKLGGGGSGVTVFSGTLEEKDIILKHGGYKDTQECFALATIAQELQSRGNSGMKERLPKFEFLYMSPKHLRSTSTQLWRQLRHVILENSSSISSTSSSISDDGSTASSTISENNNHRRNASGSRSLSPTRPLMRRKSIALSTKKLENDNHDDGNPSSLIEIRNDTLNILFQKDDLILCEDGASSDATSVEYVVPGGYSTLQSLVQSIASIQKKHLWKFTQAQKAIGGEEARTGNQWLVQGQLKGPLLENLTTQMIHVIHDLQNLTKDDEAWDEDWMTNVVQPEVQDMIATNGVLGISPQTDAFFGNALIKNFHPTKGRFPRIRAFGNQVRSKSLILTPEEEIPIYHLGQLLQDGSKMGATYEGTPMEFTLFEGRAKILRVFERAVLPQEKKTAKQQRLWTCGLADAGIHNLFLSDSNLWLFDLGTPHLESTPGFLTKFLFSFFHTLGMEEITKEDEDGNTTTTWVQRFFVNGNDKLELTPETKNLLPQSYHAFETVLDRIVADIFDHDDSVRELLVLYVTLQLLSDAAFCLERWSIKGGGRARDRNHQTGIDKWLWRTLWDIYVAFDLNTPDNLKRYVAVPNVKQEESE